MSGRCARRYTSMLLSEFVPLVSDDSMLLSEFVPLVSDDASDRRRGRQPFTSAFHLIDFYSLFVCRY